MPPNIPANLVSMTRFRDDQEGRPGTPVHGPGAWRLQDAKAQFSEVVRRARSQGPQQVSVHGRAAVVVVDVEEFRRLQGQQSGQALVDVLQASPCPESALDVPRAAMPVRDVAL